MTKDEILAHFTAAGMQRMGLSKKIRELNELLVIAARDEEKYYEMYAAKSQKKNRGKSLG